MVSISLLMVSFAVSRVTRKSQYTLLGVNVQLYMMYITFSPCPSCTSVLSVLVSSFAFVHCIPLSSLSYQLFFLQVASDLNLKLDELNSFKDSLSFQLAEVRAKLAKGKQ